MKKQRLRLYCRVKRESNVWRSYDIIVRQEKALGDVRSLIALAVQRSIANLATLSLGLVTFQTPLATFF